MIEPHTHARLQHYVKKLVQEPSEIILGVRTATKLECTVIEQAKASEHEGNRKGAEGIGSGVGAMIEGQTILAEEIQR
jgi:hypothetical protein